MEWRWIGGGVIGGFEKSMNTLGAGQSTSEVNMNGKGSSPHSMNTDPFFSTRNLAGTGLAATWDYFK